MTTTPARNLEDELRARHSLGAAVDLLEACFAQAALETPRLDARLLVAAAAGIDVAALYGRASDPLDPATATDLAEQARRRLRHEPVSRILGRRGFWTLDLAITPDVLDPRPDTETLVEAVVKAWRAHRTAPLRILDLCTGSGAILAALLSEFPNATGLGTDISAAACALARRNLAANGLERRGTIRVADWAKDIDGPFDIVVSNPPYIETAALAGLDPQVRHFDPHLALDGGPDGLDAYRIIAAALPGLLRPGNGTVFLEIGATQAAAVRAIVAAAGITHISVTRDLGGQDRVVSGQTESPPRAVQLAAWQTAEKRLGS